VNCRPPPGPFNWTGKLMRMFLASGLAVTEPEPETEGSPSVIWLPVRV
jgi:hypothetical protein